MRLPSKLLRWLGERFVGSFVRQVADGKYGLWARAAYWKLAGWKTPISIALMAAAFLALGLGVDPKTAELAGWVGGLLAGAGLLDKAVRSGGRPAWLTDNWAYRLAVEYAGTIAAALSAALAWTMSAACHPFTAWSWSLSCAVQTQILLGVILLLVYVGVLDGAMLARAPIPPIARRRIDEIRPWGPGPGAALLLAGLGLLLLTGCGTMAQLRVGGEPLAHPDERVVNGYICLGQLDAARLYLEGPSFAWLGPARERYLIDGQEAKLRGECPCPSPSCAR